MSEPEQTSAQDRENTAVGSLPAQQSRGSVSSFLFITFVLFMFTNSGGEDFLIKNLYRDSLQSLQYQLSNFSAWRNGTSSNFTLPERDFPAQSLVNSIMAFGFPLDPESASYYDNITGFIHGPAEFRNLSAYINQSVEAPQGLDYPLPPWSGLAIDFISTMNDTEILERSRSWNWTACSKISMRVLEKKPVFMKGNIQLNVTTAMDDISLLHGKLELVDENTNEDLTFDMEAVHFISNGSVYGFAEPSGRHIDIRLLPSIVPASHINETSQAVEAALLSQIAHLQGMIDAGTVGIDVPSGDDKPKSTCPFTLYAQIIPTELPARLMKELESELEHPTGISMVERPPLKLNGVLLSKECGLLYEIREAEGLKSQRFWRKVTTYSGTAALVYLVLLILLSRQTEASRTPAGISRVSRWSFIAQAAADLISFVGHITFGVVAEGRPSMSLIAPAFLACILLVFEAQFGILIQQIQAPEETSSSPPPSPPVSSRITPDSTEGPTSSPTPIGSPPPALRSVVTRLWLQVWSNPQVRFCLSVLTLLTVFVRILVSPSLALLVIGFIYSMFWIPQIIRSARRGTSAGLRKEYLVGTTICRAFFALYFFACPKNVLGVDTSWWIYVLLGFVCLQVAVVILQEYFGPAFFLPQGYIEVRTYDYHPAMPLPDSEAPEQSLGDCAICMDTIVVHPDHRRRSLSEKNRRQSREKEKSGAGGILGAVQMGIEAAGRGTGGARKTWAVAPCHHVFHTACLERWLAIKNICPQCRRPLPPL